MNQEYISLENTKKIANYDKLLAENTMLKSDNYILKNKSKENDKRYLKIIEEKNKKMRDEYDGRRRYLVEGFRQLGLPCEEPKGAFYVFPDIRGTGLTSDEFCEQFLTAERVAVIPGSAFGQGGEGFVRACYSASMQDLGEALARLKHFLKQRNMLKG